MRILRSIAASMLIIGPVQAGEIADAGRQAEELAGQGNYLDALNALSAAQDIIWQQSPLMVRKAFFVAAEPGGFGIYDLRNDSVFKKTDKLLIYAEPVGFGYGLDGALYTIDISMDFEIKSRQGQSLHAQQDFGTLQLRSRVPNREFFAKITYDFGGLNPGDYEVITTLKDRPTGKTVSFALPFTMAE